MNWELDLLYKQETSNRSTMICDGFYRIRGEWIVSTDSPLGYILDRRAGYLEIPDPQYVEWLESKVLEMINNKKQNGAEKRK